MLLPNPIFIHNQPHAVTRADFAAPLFNHHLHLVLMLTPLDAPKSLARTRNLCFSGATLQELRLNLEDRGFAEEDARALLRHARRRQREQHSNTFHPAKPHHEATTPPRPTKPVLVA